MSSANARVSNRHQIKMFHFLVFVRKIHSEFLLPFIRFKNPSEIRSESKSDIFQSHFNFARMFQFSEWDKTKTCNVYDRLDNSLLLRWQIYYCRFNDSHFCIYQQHLLILSFRLLTPFALLHSFHSFSNVIMAINWPIMTAAKRNP